MKDGYGSRTAERVAERRAAHQLLDKPVVFEDPLALTILDPEAASRVRSSVAEIESSPLSPFLRAAFAARSRFAEDQLAVAVEQGIRQYVVLGAGFDTFAYRNPHGALRVFEVDHPATQERKRQRLVEAKIVVSPQTTYIPVDFANTSFATAMRASSYDFEAPGFFSWLGVVPYLERTAVEQTLQFVASLPTSTTIVFDYGTPPELLSRVGRLVFDRMAARVAAVGEPWKTFFYPGELQRILVDVGFSAVEDLGPEELNLRYFSGRADRLRVGEMLRIAKAVV